MSLEIRELSIKVSVSQNAEKTGEEETASPTSPSVSGGGQMGDSSAIVAACVEQVIEILKDKFKDK